MNRLATTAVISTLALLVSTPALAQGYQYDPHAGLYLGAGVGNAVLDNDSLDLLDSLGANTDDSDTAYKLFAGYDFNANFALEASFVDFGEFEANAGTESLKASADGFGIGLVGRLPIQSGFSIHAKVGMFAWDGDIDYSESTTSSDFSLGEDGTDPFYGVGAEYVIDRVMIRGEYERYDLSDSGEDFTIDLASVSLGYLF
ncbi:porin family protein [Halomonas salinarum]|uniref:porin family protein n=1 Tax=Halomonas salinarum TaxID=1158993 RepID=UPI00143BF22A|nr:porin family protein [Halomonas salinarum]